MVIDISKITLENKNVVVRSVTIKIIEIEKN